MLNRRLIVALLATTTLACNAVAQSGAYPSMPIKLVVPFAAGGTGDVVARLLAEKAAVDLAQTIVVDNRAGAGGVIGADSVAKAKADGYSLLFLATAHVILPNLQKTPYEWERDFKPVFGITATPLVFAVQSKSGIRNLTDLAAAAKASPQGLNYASGGAGSISHLAAARLVQRLKVSGVHVPYRGFSAAIQGLLGDQIQLICATVSDVAELAKGGEIRVLAVTSEQRIGSMPEVPTMAELGFNDFVAASWNAVVAPANTPAAAINRLSSAFAQAVRDPEVLQKLGQRGVMIRAMSAADVGNFLREESSRWARVIQENHIKLDN